MDTNIRIHTHIAGLYWPRESHNVRATHMDVFESVSVYRVTGQGNIYVCIHMYECTYSHHTHAIFAFNVVGQNTAYEHTCIHAHYVYIHTHTYEYLCIYIYIYIIYIERERYIHTHTHTHIFTHPQTVRMWNLETGDCLKKFDHPSGVSCLLVQMVVAEGVREVTEEMISQPAEIRHVEYLVYACIISVEIVVQIREQSQCVGSHTGHSHMVQKMHSHRMSMHMYVNICVCVCCMYVHAHRHTKRYTRIKCRLRPSRHKECILHFV